MLRVMKKAAEIVIIALATVMAALAVTSVLASGKPADSSTWRLGFKPMTVLGGSMEPAIHVGSLTIIGRTDPALIRTGDIITFATPDEAQTGSLKPDTITTHRVVAIDHAAGGTAFQTKGDANEDPDTWPVPASAVIGRPVLTIPYLGYVARWASGKTGFIVLVVLPGLLLIGSEIRRLLKPEAKPQPSATTETTSS